MANLKSNFQNKAVCLVIENIANLLFLSVKSNSNKKYNNSKVLSLTKQSYPQSDRVHKNTISFSAICQKFKLFKISKLENNRQSYPQLDRVIRNLTELSVIRQSSIDRVIRNLTDFIRNLTELHLQHIDLTRFFMPLKLLNSKFYILDINPMED
jgi:hypothetical protein